MPAHKHAELIKAWADGTGVSVVDLPFVGTVPNLKLSFEEGKLIDAEVIHA